MGAITLFLGSASLSLTCVEELGDDKLRDEEDDDDIKEDEELNEDKSTGFPEIDPFPASADTTAFELLGLGNSGASGENCISKSESPATEGKSSMRFVKGVGPLALAGSASSPSETDDSDDSEEEDDVLSL